VRPDVKVIRARWQAIDDLKPNDFYSPAEMGAARCRMMADARTDVPALCDRVEALEAALRANAAERGCDDDPRGCTSCRRARAALEDTES